MLDWTWGYISKNPPYWLISALSKRSWAWVSDKMRQILQHIWINGWKLGLLYNQHL